MNTNADDAGSLWTLLGIQPADVDEPMPDGLWDRMISVAVDPETPAPDNSDDLVPSMDDTPQSFPDDHGALAGDLDAHHDGSGTQDTDHHPDLDWGDHAGSSGHELHGHELPGDGHVDHSDIHPNLDDSGFGDV